MLSEAAHRLNIRLVFLDAENSPAKQIDARSAHINGSFTDPVAVRQLAKECDLLTVEIEHVDTDVLEEISTGTETRPDWRTVPGSNERYSQAGGPFHLSKINMSRSSTSFSTASLLHGRCPLRTIAPQI